MSTQNTLSDHADINDRNLGTTSTGNQLETQNIHATGTLGTEIDLRKLIPDLENTTDYIDDRGFLCTKYEIPINNDGDTTTGSIQLWRTGSYTITGINTMPQLNMVETRFLDELKTLGISLDDTGHATVSNYVATLTLDTDTRLNLSAIAIALGLENIEYEPEQFPGVLYRPPNQDGVCLIFGSGSLLITGITSPDSVYDTAEHVQNQLLDLHLI